MASLRDWLLRAITIISTTLFWVRFLRPSEVWQSLRCRPCGRVRADPDEQGIVAAGRSALLFLQDRHRRSGFRCGIRNPARWTQTSPRRSEWLPEQPFRSRRATVRGDFPSRVQALKDRELATQSKPPHARLRACRKRRQAGLGL